MMRKVVFGAGLLVSLTLLIAGAVAQAKNMEGYETILLGGAASLLGTAMLLANLPEGWEKGAIGLIGTSAVLGLVAQGVERYFKGLPHIPSLKIAGIIAVLLALLFAQLDGGRRSGG